VPAELTCDCDERYHELGVHAVGWADPSAALPPAADPIGLDPRCRMRLVDRWRRVPA